MVGSGKQLRRRAGAALIEVRRLRTGPERVDGALLDCRGLAAIAAKEDGGIESVTCVDVQLYIAQKPERVGFVCKHLRHVAASGESQCHS